MTEVLLHNPIETTIQTLPLFERVYDEHFRDIVGFLYSESGDYPLAQDLAQELFEKLFVNRTNAKREITNIRELDKIAAFLRRSAKNMLHDYRRTRKNGNTDDMGEFLDIPERVSTDPAKLAIIREGVQERTEMIGVLKQGMQNLPPNYRHVLEASYVEGLSDPEIALSLDVPLGTIKSRKHRARNTLVGRVFPEGIPTKNLPNSLREVGDYPF
jgi:RNA polymerase sigma-70 factor (ECF subfamily)